MECGTSHIYIYSGFDILPTALHRIYLVSILGIIRRKIFLNIISSKVIRCFLYNYLINIHLLDKYAVNNIFFTCIFVRFEYELVWPLATPDSRVRLPDRSGREIASTVRSVDHIYIYSLCLINSGFRSSRVNCFRVLLVAVNRLK